MYFVDMEKISDYDLVSKTHIIDKDKQVIEQKLTKIYTPNYEKYIHVKHQAQVSNSPKIKKKKDGNLKSNSIDRNSISNINNHSTKKKDCDCNSISNDNSQDVIKKILSKNYLNFKFEKDVVSISDEQKKSILNLNYNDAKKISIVNYPNLETLKNDALVVVGKRAENIINLLPIETKGKTLVENRDCKEMQEKCGTTEIRLSY